MKPPSFEWDAAKDAENQRKHGVSFKTAEHAFADSNCVIAADLDHSETEQRFFCFGRAGDGVLTVRFTYREDRIRIFGAGYWRKGKATYEEKNKVHGRADRENPSDIQGFPPPAGQTGLH